VLLADGRVAGEIDRPDRASVTDALQNLATQNLGTQYPAARNLAADR
jgi:hypothetical protein